MFKSMRNKKREVSREVVDVILQRGEYGILSTIGEHGYPCITPLSYVYMNNCIYFHCAEEGEKLDNIRRNGKVAFSVVNDTKIIPVKFTTDFKSVVIYGEAKEIDGEAKKEALRGIVKKYSPDFIEAGERYIEKSSHVTKIVEIKIDHVTGKVIERQ